MTNSPERLTDIMKNGFNKERELVNFLLIHGYEAVRVAGSGAGTKRGLPDIIAGNPNVKYAIELKTSTKDKIYIQKYQINGLIDFSKAFGAIPVISAKFTRLPYIFLTVPDLKYTKQGNVIITREYASKYKNKCVITAY